MVIGKWWNNQNSSELVILKMYGKIQMFKWNVSNNEKWVVSKNKGNFICKFEFY
jgi:hypothetical protein